MIRIVIADDSAFFLNALKEKIESSGKIEVVGLAHNGKEAIDVVKQTNPDLLVLDCQMPVMDGLECLQLIKHEWPGPVFILSSLTYEGATTTIKALEYGAVDFLHKPGEGEKNINDIIGTLIERIEVIILQYRLKRIKTKYKTVSSPTETLIKKLGRRTRPIDLIAMGSSTGGVQASLEIIPKLAAGIKPMVWVQHMPLEFLVSLAKRINASSKVTVKLGEDKETVLPGTCYLAPSGYHMRVRKSGSYVHLDVHKGEKVSSHMPSCDVLFESVAEGFSDNALGVILSGMGDDGARGLEKMHQKGAFVIGQSERSCVVYGMPKMAQERGAVDIELDSADIAAAIHRAMGLTV